MKLFLEKIRFKPSAIIFIDDKLKNLEAVEQFSIKLGIPFTGFHYTVAYQLSPEPLNEKRAYFQFETLKREGKWLSDQESDKE